ncbi:ATP-binding protein [Micromonospora sp. NPDC047187]|uniref:sensor histidine kinase n=1 Tax=Micromonospora sp. NPDC047187 TaxID=3155262 RepID=UPI0033C7EE41
MIDSFLRTDLPAHLEKIGLRDAVRDDLHEDFAVRTTDWVVVACFVYRVVVAPFALIGGLSTLGTTAEKYLPVVVGLMLWNGLLAVGVLRPRLRTFMSNQAFATIDIAPAALVNLWGAAILPKGALLQPYHDVFWIYAMGTVAVWTALKGARFGLWLVVGGGLVQLGMVAINQAPIAGPGVGHILARFGWLVSAVPLPVVIMRLARQGVGLGNAEGRRAGRALERIQALRLIHDTVLQTLAQIAQRAVASEVPIEERTRHIHRLAADQVASLDRAILLDDQQRTGLVDGLQDLVRRLDVQNLRVELVTADLAADPPRAVADRLLAATREALTNVGKHAGVDRAVIHAATNGAGYEVTIRDHGRGFDATARRSGVGIPESIHRRMTEVGGHAAIWSEPGGGTRVKLVVNFDAVRKMRIGVAPHAAIALSPTTSTSVDALTNQALAWFVVVALTYRVALSPLQVSGLFANLDGRQEWLFLVAVVGVLAFDFALLIALLLGRFARVFRSWALVAVDLGLTAGLNLWSAYQLPEGTLLAPGHEVLWGYTLGAVAFWTGLRGVRAGAAIVAGGLILLVVMTIANHTALSVGVLPQLVTRQGWLIATFAIAWLLTRLARRGAQQAVDEGIKTGLAIERAWALRDLYSSVSRSLLAITVKTQSVISRDDLMDIRGIALDEVARLRSTIDHSRSGSRFAADLGRLVATFRSGGLRIELVTSQLAADPPSAVSNAFLSAVDGVLQAVVNHASVFHAVVRASSTGEGFEVVIRDHGLGTLKQADVARRLADAGMSHVGGSAKIRSEPGNGTRTQLSWRSPTAG